MPRSPAEGHTGFLALYQAVRADVSPAEGQTWANVGPQEGETLNKYPLKVTRKDKTANSEGGFRLSQANEEASPPT